MRFDPLTPAPSPPFALTPARRNALPAFDELDSESIASGGGVDLTISVKRPATLISALTVNGEGSRFAPEFVGLALKGELERAGYDVVLLNYFVDSVYKTDPKRYDPDEEILQLTISKRSSSK